MRRVAPLFLTGLVALAACSDDITPVTPSAAAPAFDESATSGSDTYLVRFKGNGVPAEFASQVAALGGEVIFAHPVGIAAVAGLSGAAADQLAAFSGVAGVDADGYSVVDAPTDASPELAEAELASPSNPATAVRYPRQWNLQVIKANSAWTAGQLGSVKVGILDTGLDYLHPDLVGRVDLTLSRSFLSSAENARVQATWPGAHPIADLHYHGTHVGATVASNAYVAAGVTSKVTLVGLKVCTPGTPANGFRGTCPTNGTLAAILYAADNGIPVINMSLGGWFYRTNASARGGDGPSFLATINRVMAYANQKGTTVVVAAGNDAADMDHDGNVYRSYCGASHVICVSATGPTAAAGVNGPWTNTDALAGYSNYGRSGISVAAPGGNAVSVSAACSGFTIVSSVIVCRQRFFNSPTSWSAFTLGANGTSMASPHVAGLAALIASQGYAQPSQIRARLQQGADDLGEPGMDPKYGHGRINVARTLGL